MADFNGQIITEPDPLQSAPTSADAQIIISNGGSSPPVVPSYAQRVWSTGLAAWCYFTGALNPTPASVDTTPNWTGSATDYNVISRRLN